MFINACVRVDFHIEGLGTTTCILCHAHRAQTIGENGSNKIGRFVFSAAILDLCGRIALFVAISAPGKLIKLSDEYIVRMISGRRSN